MEALKRMGTILSLAVTYEEMAHRVTNITTRGIVLKEGTGLLDAYRERVPLYQKYSDYVVECTGKSIEESVAEIAGLLGQTAI